MLKLSKILLEDFAPQEQDTINFSTHNIGKYAVVLATLGNKRVGALRLLPFEGAYKVDQVIVDDSYRGLGVGKELYLTAFEDLGEFYSDSKRTQAAQRVWDSLVRDGYAIFDEDKKLYKMVKS